MIKVLVAEDDFFLRDGLKKDLERDEEIRVCGLAADGEEAYKLCLQERPDVDLKESDII
ncbi:MAG: hypothetical protein FWF88_03760 [Peptococcaceae bacterium]|nr:hypothetical protein [Peptococcaceae bacterium]